MQKKKSCSIVYTVHYKQSCNNGSIQEKTTSIINHLGTF